MWRDGGRSCKGKVLDVFSADIAVDNSVGSWGITDKFPSVLQFNESNSPLKEGCKTIIYLYFMIYKRNSNS